jgi:hypothetical protein
VRSTAAAAARGVVLVVDDTAKGWRLLVTRRCVPFLALS